MGHGRFATLAERTSLPSSPALRLQASKRLNNIFRWLLLSSPHDIIGSGDVKGLGRWIVNAGIRAQSRALPPTPFLSPKEIRPPRGHSSESVSRSPRSRPALTHTCCHH